MAEALRLQAQHLHLDNQLLRQSHAYEHFSNQQGTGQQEYMQSMSGILELRKKLVLTIPLDDLDAGPGVNKEMPSPGESISTATDPQLKSWERHHDLVILFVEIP